MDWTLESIKKLIEDETFESLRLEFKDTRSLSSKKDQHNNGVPEKSRKDYGEEASKDISAMANSDGGVIIYGITEDGETQRASDLDVGCPPNAKKVEWIQVVLTEKIFPPLTGVDIIPIKLDNGNNEIYVIKVPKSIHTAPHQAYDKRYYYRVEARNKPLEHYQVVDLMRRTSSPDLSVSMSSPQAPLDWIRTPQEESSFSTHASFSVINLSNTPAMYVMFFLLVDSRLALFPIAEWVNNGPAQNIDGTLCNSYYLPYGPTNAYLSRTPFIPIVKEFPVSILNGAFKHIIDKPVIDSGEMFTITFKVCAVGSAEKVFTFKIAPPRP